MAYSRNLVMSVDISGYSGNDDKRKERLQRDLIQLLDEAAERTGLDRRAWHNQPKGDEVLALVPDSSLEPVMVDRYVRELAAALRRLNLDRNESGRMRLRVAMDVGVSYPTENGFGGRAVVTATRLNGDAARTALAGNPRAGLVLILSDELYRDVVLEHHTSYPPESFTEVKVAEKEYAGVGWISFIDPASPVDTPDAGGTAPAAAAQTVTTHVGTVHGETVIFGIANR